MENRDSFIFYRSFFEATKPLKKNEKAELFDAICNYALNQKEGELKPFAKAMFALIQPQLDANYKKYLNGKKPKEKTSKVEANPKQTVSKTEGNVNDNANTNVNVNNNANVTKGTKLKFVQPTNEDLEKFFKDKGLNDFKAKEKAQAFLNFYDSNGWKIGKNPMKSWQGAAGGQWMKSESNFTSQPKTVSNNPLHLGKQDYTAR
jgi:phenylalanyl-tRNA synthetase alpha subunit